MKIGFCGTHSVGKTTLLNKLRTLPELSGYTFVTEIVRDLKAKGFDINENTTNESQLLIVNDFLYYLLTEPKFICDRTLVDAYAYTMHSKKISAWVKTYYKKLLEKYVNNYDIIFYIPIEFDMEFDGVRTCSEDYRRSIDQEIVYCLRAYREKFHVLKGTVDERINTILGAVRGKN